MTILVFRFGNIGGEEEAAAEEGILTSHMKCRSPGFSPKVHLAISTFHLLDKSKY